MILIPPGFKEQKSRTAESKNMKALETKAFLVGTIDLELARLVSTWYALGPRVEGMIWGCVRSLMGIFNTLWYRRVQPATHSISG